MYDAGKPTGIAFFSCIFFDKSRFAFCSNRHRNVLLCQRKNVARGQDVVQPGPFIKFCPVARIQNMIAI